jgi:hypothetical protein
MTHTTDTRIDASQAAETEVHLNMMPVHHTVLLRQAQGEVGRDIAKAIKTGTQWINDRQAKFRQALVDGTQPPTTA